MKEMESDINNIHEKTHPGPQDNAAFCWKESHGYETDKAIL